MRPSPGFCICTDQRASSNGRALKLDMRARRFASCGVRKCAIVGWSMADHLRAKLVVDALQMALSRQRPGPGLVHRSDQGSQYLSLAFGQRARDAGIAVSMESKGDCYDNAVAESFFAKLKKELVNRHSWPTRRELGAAVFEYVFYNCERRHSTLDYRSPREFEKITHPAQSGTQEVKR